MHQINVVPLHFRARFGSIYNFGLLPHLNTMFRKCKIRHSILKSYGKPFIVQLDIGIRYINAQKVFVHIIRREKKMYMYVCIIYLYDIKVYRYLSLNAFVNVNKVKNERRSFLAGSHNCVCVGVVLQR